MLEDLIFEPMRFIENIGYMGAGMLGIFVVIGLIVVATVALNKLTSLEKKDKE